MANKDRSGMHFPGPAWQWFLLFSILVTAFLATVEAEPILASIDLKLMKEDLLKGQRGDFRGRLELLADAGPEDEAVLLDFLKKEIIALEKAYDEDQWDDLNDLVEPLLKSLVRMGGRDTVKVLVKWIDSWEWSGEGTCPLDPGAALVCLSQRIDIQEEQLERAFDNTNPELRAMLQQVWRFIEYDPAEVADKQKVAMDLVRREQFIAGMTALLPDWEEIAHLRGYAVRTANRDEALRRLITKVSERARRAAEKARIDKRPYEEWTNASNIEYYLAYRALAALTARDREGVFNLLVQIIEKDEYHASLTAATSLYQLTGRHFPVTLYLDYGNLRTNINVPLKAAKAWRQWRRNLQGKPLPSRDEAAFAKERRLAELELHELMQDRKPIPGTANELLAEILATDDRAILARLSRALAGKVLSETMVERVIAAHVTVDSPEKRRILDLALAGSEVPKAQAFIKKNINKSTPAEAVIRIVRDGPKLTSAIIELYTRLYREHPSAKVREAITAAMTDPGNRFSTYNTARDEFLQMVINESPSEDQRIKAMRIVIDRPGVNKKGVWMVAWALKTAETDSLRITIYGMLLERDAGTWMESLLLKKETRAVKIAALEAYLPFLKTKAGMSPNFSQREIRALRSSLANETNRELKDLIGGCLAVYRRTEVEELLARLRKRSHITGLLGGIKKRGEFTPGDRNTIRAQFEVLEVVFEHAFRDLEKIKARYGDLPERPDAVKQMHAIKAGLRGTIQSLLDELGEE
ncbi:hypothetical protein ACFL4W_02060 [Planctomycetota bacterium]